MHVLVNYLIFWTKLNIKDLIFFFALWKIITIFCIFGVIANNSFCKPRFMVKTNKVDIKAYLYFSGSSHCPENFSFQILALANWYFFNKLNVTNNVMQRFSLPIIYDFTNMKYWEFQIFWCQELSITFKNKGNRFVGKETLDIWSIKEKFVLYYMSFSLEIVMWLTSIVKYNKIIDNVWSMEC